MRKLVSRRVCGDPYSADFGAYSLHLSTISCGSSCSPSLRDDRETDSGKINYSVSEGARWRLCCTCGALNHVRFYPFPQETSEQVCLCPTTRRPFALTLLPKSKPQ